jgi:hypothetical protein
VSHSPTLSDIVIPIRGSAPNYRDVSYHPPPWPASIVVRPSTPHFAIPAVRNVGRPTGLRNLLRSGLTPRRERD